MFVFKEKTAYEVRISDWGSDVCSSELKENVSDLVRTFVIDAQAIDRQRASSQILHFRQLEETVKKIGEEIAELQGCEDAYKLQQDRSEEHTSELQSLMRNSYAVSCLKKKQTNSTNKQTNTQPQIRNQ